MLVRQLEEEVVKTRQVAKETNPEIKAHIEALQIENDHLTREIAILKETIRVRGTCKYYMNTPAFRTESAISSGTLVGLTLILAAPLLAPILDRRISGISAESAEQYVENNKTSLI